ncbi:MAG: FtsB family cell division protein [Desulfococcaceae bacterium]
MHTTHRIGMSLAGAVMAALFLFIFFGDNGLRDLRMKQEARDDLIRKNQVLAEKNLGIYHQIQRLADARDLAYIENIARRELGLIKPQEIIFKLVHADQRKTHRESREF